MKWKNGGCHCGSVRIEVYGEPSKLLLCNCSVCTKKGYLHWIVSQSDFRVTGEEHLSLYQFNTKKAKHYFCQTCGVAPYYIARSDPDRVDVNARCVDGLNLSSLPIEHFDGQNWETHFEIYKQTRG